MAEVREELLQGIAEANPQHRASGFEIGLDGWLNFTSGDHTQELNSTRSGQHNNVSGRDVRWQPDTGAFTLNSGHTQFVRARDEFNNWFGNVNNQPMFHYVVEDAYRRRSGLSGPPYQHLLNPPIAPPVHLLVARKIASTICIPSIALPALAAALSVVCPGWVTRCAALRGL